MNETIPNGGKGCSDNNHTETLIIDNEAGAAAAQAGARGVKQK
ncbi:MULTISPECIES: hypothetical protein [Edwardsiella]|uniref:Uncharacterized protein n=1 Tax=Edwardsiella anguillarum ET080813 TaxID=667120 RepID=A0A076LTX6_9GAMM|nr:MULTISPECIES: hypothetical protein [Edwardsiella]AIJ09928.1 Hypothetical protein ETEE_3507 [Edwardsiella anguillarum ET080813]